MVVVVVVATWARGSLLRHATLGMLPSMEDGTQALARGVGCGCKPPRCPPTMQLRALGRPRGPHHVLAAGARPLNRVRPLALALAPVSSPALQVEVMVAVAVAVAMMTVEVEVEVEVEVAVAVAMMTVEVGVGVAVEVAVEVVVGSLSPVPTQGKPRAL